MILSHEHRFIFLKTRKTAGTSIEIALSRHCGPDDIVTPISPEDEELRTESGGMSPRNYESPPLPVRAWNHMPAQRILKIAGRDVWDSYFKFVVERNPWEVALSSYRYYCHRHLEPMSLERFLRGGRLEKLAKNPGIYRIGGHIAVDKVCRYESLAHELAEVWERIGLTGTPELPHAKTFRQPDPRPYRDVMSAKGAERVRALFADTISDFGYEY